MSQRHGASEIWFVFPDAWPRASRPVCAYQTVSGGFSALPTPFFSSSHSLFQLLSISPPYWGLSLHLSQHHQVKMEAVLCPPDLLLKGTFSRGKRDKKNQLASGQLCLYSAVMVISCFSLAILQAWAGLRSSVLSALLLPPARHTVWHAEPNSLIRDQAQTPCIGRWSLNR